MPQVNPTVLESVGRSAAVSRSGKSNAATRVFVVAYGRTVSPLPLPSAVPGLPAVGTAHPNVPGIILQSYDVAEGTRGEIIYTATYGKTEDQQRTGGGGEGGEDPDPTVGEAETLREWSHGSVARDLTHDAVTGAAVMNANGEPFESVPQVNVDTLVFHVTRKTYVFDSALFLASGSVNAAGITIEKLGFVAPHCGLLSVSITKLYGETYQYQEDVTVEVVPNCVKLEPDGNPVDIGHDVALLLAGYRYKTDRYDGAKTLKAATDIDAETGEEVPAAAPVLLNPDGTLFTPTDPSKGGYSKRFAAYPEETWRETWFR